jgi:hypothetical protein
MMVRTCGKNVKARTVKKALKNIPERKTSVA